MSKFYGTLTSDKGSTTRAGHHWIKATAQSWEGSVCVSLFKGATSGELLVEIEVGEGSTSCPSKSIWRKPLKELLNGSA